MVLTTPLLHVLLESFSQNLTPRAWRSFPAIEFSPFTTSLQTSTPDPKLSRIANQCTLVNGQTEATMLRVSQRTDGHTFITSSHLAKRNITTKVYAPRLTSRPSLWLASTDETTETYGIHLYKLNHLHSLGGYRFAVRPWTAPR